MAEKVAPFMLTYAPMKTGKTTAQLKAFPDADVIGERGAIEPLCDQWQIVYPRRKDPGTIHDIVKDLKKRDKKDKRPVLVDDLTLVLDSTLIAFETSSDMRAVYGDLHKAMIKLRDVAQDMGVAVLMNCHEKPPEVKDGRTIPGGPMLPGKAGAAIGAGVQTLARAIRTNRKVGFPVVYAHNPKDPTWPTGDRHGLLFDQAPMNPRAMLVAAGYTLARSKGLEWQEDAMFEMAELFLELDPKAKDFDKAERALLDACRAQLLEVGHAPPHVAWAIEDGRDLAAYVRRRDMNLFQFL